MDRAKVIKGLECCVAYYNSPGYDACDDCPYDDDGDIGTCANNAPLLADALALIKEQERHGRWIKMTGMMPPEYHGHYECSECHWHMKGIRSSWTREEELTYCPNCGVIMDGGEDDISKETDA